MKKLISTLLAVVMIASFAGCSINITPNGSESAYSAVNSNASDVNTPASVASEITPEEPSTPVAESSTDVTASQTSTEGTFTFYNLSIQLPDGFSVSDPDATTPIAMHSSYPTVSDNITFSKSGADSISTYTEDLLKTTYSSIFEGFEMLNYKKTTVSGCDTLEINYKITMSGSTIEQIQDMIFASDATYIITYTIVDESYRAIFSNSLSTVTIAAA